MFGTQGLRFDEILRFCDTIEKQGSMEMAILLYFANERIHGSICCRTLATKYTRRRAAHVADLF